MTILEAKQFIASALTDLYQVREAENIAVLLIEHFTGYSKMNQFLNKTTLLPPAQLPALTESVDRLAKGEPIQYIMGKTWFMNLEILVNEHTLIPRPETEELVETAIKYISQKKIRAPKIIEVGVGSGCIAITLAKYIADARVTGIDISEEALAIAQMNASKNNVAVNWMKMDFLNSTTWTQLDNYDILISNPPYIRASEANSMHQNVVAYEPHTALFVPDNDPLVFYKAIELFSKKHLNKDGAIFVEINEGLGKETKAIFDTAYNTFLIKDMQGKDRMIAAYQNKPA